MAKRGQSLRANRMSRSNPSGKRTKSTSQASYVLPYRYKPLLQPDSFRILHLHPGNKDDPITCSLAVENIKTAKPYEAVSYAWGDPHDRRPITCDRRSINITVNLWTALQRLRLPDRARRLWADAICINQQDRQERGHQVATMGLLYKSASPVLVWLGPDNEGEAEDNFALLREIYDMETEQLERYGSFNTIPEVSPEDVGQYDELRWTSLVRLFKLPWFSRLWVIQEVGLARSALVIYGDAEIDWVTFRVAIDYIEKKMTTVRRSFHVKADRVTRIWTLYPMEEGEMQVRQTAGGSELRLDFSDVLFQACERLASDTRDHVYAFLAHPAAKVGAGTIVSADYTLSTQQLYELVAIRIIEQTQNLRILSRVQHEAHTLQNGFPSWVPQWDLGSYSSVLDCYGGGYTYYDAAAGSKLSLAGSAGHGVLRLRGLVFDAISFRSDIFDKTAISLFGPTNSQITGAKMMKSLTAQIDNTDSRLAYPQADRLKAFSLTLIAGTGWSTKSSPHGDVEKDNLAQHLGDFAVYCSRAYDIDRSAGNSMGESLQVRKDAEGGDWWRFAHRASRRCHNNRLLITQKGYLGLGPEVMQEGDLCCILYGARTPFILRRCNDHYLFLGEAYIHGIMGGEAMEMLRNGELQEEVFEIH